MSIRSATAIAYAMPVKQAISLVVMITLARLLSPSDYGIVAAGQTIIGFLWVFSSFGLYEAAVQKETLTSEETNAFFALNMLIGALLFVASCASAIPLALFFRVDELLVVVPVLSISILLTAAGQVQNAILSRRQDYKAIVVLELAGHIVAAIIAVAMALMGFKHWALVGLNLAMAGIPSIGAWLATGWRPGPVQLVGLRQLRASLRFALGVVIGNATNYLTSQVDRAVIGRAFSITELGLYTRAQQLALYANNLFFTGPHRFVTARLSRCQHDAEQLRREFILLVSIAQWGAMVFNFALAASALPVVLLLFGERWSAMGEILVYVALGNAAYVTAYAYQWLHLSTGAGAGYVATNSVRLVLTVCAVLIGVTWGVVGIAIAYAVSVWLFAILSARSCGREIGGGIGELLRALWVPCLIASLATALSLVVVPLGDTSIVGLVCRSALICAIYLALSAVLCRNTLDAVASIVAARRLRTRGVKSL